MFCARPPVRCDAIPRQTDTQKAESPRAHSPKEVRTGVNGRGVNRQGVNRRGVNRQGVNRQGVNRQGVNGRIRSTQCSLYAPDGEIGGDFRKKCLLYEQILLYFIIQQKNIEDIRTIRQIPQFCHEKGNFLATPDTGHRKHYPVQSWDTSFLGPPEFQPSELSSSALQHAYTPYAGPI